LQALTVLNDQGFFEFAQALAARICKEAGPEDRERIDHAFRLCFGRFPSSVEETRLRELLSQQRAESEVIAQGPELSALLPCPDNLDSKTFAAWTALARVLLNLDEFITRE